MKTQDQSSPPEPWWRNVGDFEGRRKKDLREAAEALDAELDEANRTAADWKRRAESADRSRDDLQARLEKTEAQRREEQRGALLERVERGQLAETALAEAAKWCESRPELKGGTFRTDKERGAFFAFGDAARHLREKQAALKGGGAGGG